MLDKLEPYFIKFSIHGNLWNLDDIESLYKFCVESILENNFLEEEIFISYFEKYCISEYADQWSKSERARKWYEKYNLLYTALKYISKDYNIIPKN